MLLEILLSPFTRAAEKALPPSLFTPESLEDPTEFETLFQKFMSEGNSDPDSDEDFDNDKNFHQRQRS